MRTTCLDEAGNVILTEPAKRELVVETIIQRKLRAFVETGTYKGDMLAAVLPYVSQAISVELHEGNYQECLKRFRGLHVFRGDSAKLLPHLLSLVATRTYGSAMIWLDAHYSDLDSAGSHDACPLRAEIEACIRCQTPHVIFCDDARFLGRGNWPTLNEIQEIAKGRIVEVLDDIVRIWP